MIDLEVPTISSLEENKIQNIVAKCAVDANKNKSQIGVIGIPHTGMFSWQTTMSLIGLQWPPNTIVKYHLVGSSLVYDAREKIFNFAISNNADWVIFIDSDMVVPANTVTNFVNARVDDIVPEMITGLCFKRTEPFQPCFYTKARIDTKTKKPILESPIEFPDNGFMQVEGFGMACCFIRMSAIKRIKQPYFFPFPGIGEDLSFCIRARMANVKMFADLSLNVGHVSNIPIYKQHFFTARDEYLKNQDAEKGNLFKGDNII